MATENYKIGPDPTVPTPPTTYVLGHYHIQGVSYLLSGTSCTFDLRTPMTSQNLQYVSGIIYFQNGLIGHTDWIMHGSSVGDVEKAFNFSTYTKDSSGYPYDKGSKSINLGTSGTGGRIKEVYILVKDNNLYLRFEWDTVPTTSLLAFMVLFCNARHPETVNI